MYPEQPLYDMMAFNNECKRKIKHINKLLVIKGIAGSALSSYGNLTFIRVSLKEIKLTKELFVLKVE